MTGRTYELDTKALDIIIRSEHIKDFNVAAVTASAVRVIHPQRPAEHLLAKVL